MEGDLTVAPCGFCGGVVQLYLSPWRSSHHSAQFLSFCCFASGNNLPLLPLLTKALFEVSHRRLDGLAVVR